MFIDDQNFWINKPQHFSVENSTIEIVTEPRTDLWQRTFPGFRNDNAPAFLKPVEEKFFSLLIRTDFNTRCRYDQCGVIIYQDSDSWFKASVEYENTEIQRLGSVVTHNGYSDWASTDIAATQRFMYYRLSRRESDYCIESSCDGVNYQQMRIFHLQKGDGIINVGVYACSPEESSFSARFSEIKLDDCMWREHV
ncbi:MAG: DUF1349 domain-containing protein [Thermoguttaceae bacterium]